MTITTGHPFGNLLTQHLHRKHGLSQARLAAGILQEPAIISKMCKGERLHGAQARVRVLAVIMWLRNEGVLAAIEEANALLDAADMAGLHDRDAAEASLIASLGKASPAKTPARAIPIAPGRNLPEQLTSFVGREEEITHLSGLLQTTRLISLIGAGGVGKTRLACEIAAGIQTEFGDGVWMIEFAPVMESRQVLRTVAALFRLTEQPDVPLIEALITRLENCHALLFFDNCEHVVDACAELAERLLRACPRLHILATSRETLRCAGEVLWRVPSLSQSESRQLFVDRARAVRPGFEIVEDRASVLARICDQLDGIPLAIELAAARTSTLSLEQIAGRLDDRFNLLTVGRRTAIPQHQTLRAAIAWSFDLLPPVEQVLMSCLSVFAGGFTADAARAVSNRADIDDQLASLADKSMVAVTIYAGSARYQLLETIRQYCLNRLGDTGDEARVRDRHLDFFVSLAEETMDLEGPHVLAWKRRLDPDYDNLQTAFAWACQRESDGVMALRLAGAMRPYLNFQERNSNEGMGWVNTALSLGTPGYGAAAVSARARALLAKSFLCSAQSDILAAVHACEESLTLFRVTQDRIGMAWSLEWLANNLNDARAPAFAEEALLLFRETGSRDGESRALRAMATNYLRMEDRAQAARHIEQAIAIAPWQLRECILPLYNAHPERALAVCAMELVRIKGTSVEKLAWGEIRILEEYAILLLAAHQYELAHEMLETCVRYEMIDSATPTFSGVSSLIELALAEFSLGLAGSAIAHLEQAQKAAQSMSWTGQARVARCFIASARVSSGDFSDADAQDLQECLRVFRGSIFGQARCVQ